MAVVLGVHLDSLLDIRWESQMVLHLALCSESLLAAHSDHLLAVWSDFLQDFQTVVQLVGRLEHESR